MNKGTRAANRWKLGETTVKHAIACDDQSTERTGGVGEMSQPLSAFYANMRTYGSLKTYVKSWVWEHVLES